jgi:predicted sulfurtransferase
LQAYKSYLKQNPYFSDVEDQIDEKCSVVSEHMFERMVVKYRQEIVTLGKAINQESFERSLQELDDRQLKQIIDQDDPNRVILDMRNSYEYKL